MRTTTSINSFSRQWKEKRIVGIASWQAAATAVGLLLLFVGGLSFVQFGSHGLAGNDGYYHMQMGRLIRTEGLTPTFEALPLTVLNAEDYYDHHLLFHVYLALFASNEAAADGGQALTFGAKLASILLPAVAFLAFYWLLHIQRVPLAMVWALALFAVSEAFLYRMSMPRAQSASLLILLIGLHYLFTEKYWALIPAGFLYVWTYNAFPLLIVIGAIYFVAVLMLQRRVVWQAIAYPIIGIALGLLINPYFPQNLGFIAEHLAPKLGDSSVKVGNEWNPYQTWTLVRNSAGALLAVLLGTLAVGWSEKRIDVRSLTSLGLILVFGYMLFQSRRFIEYFPPFALLFLALSSAPLIAEWTRDWRPEAARLYLPLFGLLLLAYPIYHTLQDGRELIANSKPADRYADAALWLRANSEPGVHIFQTDWDDFTRLFFYNADAVYTAGLDPTFMEQYDAELYELWRDVTRGRVAQPSEVIQVQFGGEFVFTDLKHTAFIEAADEDPNLVERYRDEYAIIYQLAP